MLSDVVIVGIDVPWSICVCNVVSSVRIMLEIDERSELPVSEVKVVIVEELSVSVVATIFMYVLSVPSSWEALSDTVTLLVVDGVEIIFESPVGSVILEVLSLSVVVSTEVIVASLKLLLSMD